MTGFRKFLALVCCALVLTGGIAMRGETCNAGHADPGVAAAAGSSCCGADCGCCGEGGGCDVACACSVDPEGPIEPEAILVVHRSSPMVAAEAEKPEPRSPLRRRAKRVRPVSSQLGARRFALHTNCSLHVAHSVWRL
ncbi:MAG: hypothetical protein KDC95_05585 [Planctomycetes bacterium]|nr:hypothetical protein [Planctomycetota bacterium]